jgi:hypothetical protein
MRRWLRLGDEQRQVAGDYLEASLDAVSGQRLSEESAFLDELANRVMTRFESIPTADLLVLERFGVSRPTPQRTRTYYRRLFDENGRPTLEFRTEASETLAQSVELDLEGSIFCGDTGPLSTAPAFDLISVLNPDAASPRIRLIQVKATESRLSENCNEAVIGFQELESRKHDPDLLYRLRIIEDAGHLPAGSHARDFLVPARRDYLVSALHGTPRGSANLMTTYAHRVDGDRTRRRARLTLTTLWDDFWEQLAGRVYAQLT